MYMWHPDSLQAGPRKHRNMTKHIWVQGTLKTYKPARLRVKGVQVTRAGVRVDTNKGIRAWFMRAPFRVMREY
jgi:spore coat protein CotH